MLHILVYCVSRASRLDARGAHELGVLVALERREEVRQARRDERRPAIAMTIQDERETSREGERHLLIYRI